MAKKARSAAPVEQRYTAETLWELISSLPQEEKNRLYDEVNGDPKNEPVSELLQLLLEAYRLFDMLWNTTEKLWGSSEYASSVRQQLDEEHAKSVFGELRLKVEGFQKKRGMTQCTLETLAHYKDLVKKHGEQRGGKTHALEELLTLPSEQEKEYVVNYTESCRNHPQGKGDMEAVRQYVKRIRTTDSKRRS